MTKIKQKAILLTLFFSFTLCATHSKALILAVDKNDEKAVLALIKKGVDVNCIPEDLQFGALHVACVHQREKIVEMLLEAGADPNLVSPFLGATPLQITHSKRCSNVKIAKMLLEAGADKNFQPKPINS